MKKEKIKEVIQTLNDLTYHDWQKVKIAVEEQFRLKKIKYERELKLDSVEDLYDSILQQFG